MSEARARAATLALSGLILALAVPYSFLYLGTRLPYLEESNYLALATNMARRFSYSIDGTTSTAWWPPGYPLALVVPVWLGANLTTLRLFNFGALALTVYLMYAMVRNIASPAAGLLAAALMVGYPVLFYAAGTFFQTPLGCCLFVWVLCRLSRPDGLSARSLPVTGLIFGCLILTVPSFVFQLVVLAAWVAWVRPAARWRGVVALVVPALLVVSVWSARTYAVFHEFVFVSNNGGINLFIGNSEHSSPNAAPDVRGVYESYPLFKAAGLNEVEQDRYYRRRAIEFILEDKARAVKLYVFKNLNYFNIRNQLYAASEMSLARDVVMLLTYGPLLGLFILRLILVRRFPLARFERLLLLLYFTNIPLAALFITRVRYRLPFDLLMIAVVAMFVSQRPSGRPTVPRESGPSSTTQGVKR
jgi:hypothetical protein